MYWLWTDAMNNLTTSSKSPKSAIRDLAKQVRVTEPFWIVAVMILLMLASDLRVISVSLIDFTNLWWCFGCWLQLVLKPNRVKMATFSLDLVTA